MNQFRRALIICVVSLCLGLSFNYLFWAQSPGVNWPLFTIMLLGGWWLISGVHGRPFPQQWLILPLTFFALMVCVRASVLLTFLNLVACVGLLLLIVRQASGVMPWKMGLRDWLATSWLVVAFIRPLGDTISALVRLNGLDFEHGIFRRMVIGAVISVPLLIVFGGLLASADSAFAQIAQKLVSWEVSFEVYVQVGLVALTTVGLIGAYSYLMLKHTPVTESDDHVARPFGLVETNTVLGMVGAMFAAFIVVQLPYLFNGTQIIDTGVTYAEYARKGFFELLAVGLLSMALLLVADRFVMRQGQKHDAWFGWLSSLLVAEVLVILVSAFKRLWLYEEAYGFSTLRLYSHGFTIYLAIIFGFVLYKIVRSQTTKWWIWRAAITSLAALAVMNVMNPDAIIARLNLDRYERTTKLDTNYLVSLSADAVPALTQAAHGSDPIARDIKDKLAARKPELKTYQPAWQSFRYSDWLASKSLQNPKK